MHINKFMPVACLFIRSFFVPLRQVVKVLSFAEKHTSKLAVSLTYSYLCSFKA